MILIKTTKLHQYKVQLNLPIKKTQIYLCQINGNRLANMLRYSKQNFINIVTIIL